MIQEPFAYGSSLIHRIDPRTRVIFATAYAFVVALSSRFPALLMALFISFILTGLACLDMREMAKRTLLVNGLILFFWLVLPITFRGEALFQLGPLVVTRPGVLLSARITLKSNAILLAFMSLVATMSIATMGQALHRLKVPAKMVHLLLLTYRYVFVIEQEFQRLARAARIRGFQPGTNIHTYRTYAYLLGMLFVRASARADRVHQAMLCRGFRGRFYCLKEFSMSRIDWIWSGFMTALISFLAIMEWTKIIY